MQINGPFQLLVNIQQIAHFYAAAFRFLKAYHRVFYFLMFTTLQAAPVLDLHDLKAARDRSSTRIWS